MGHVPNKHKPWRVLATPSQSQSMPCLVPCARPFYHCHCALSPFASPSTLRARHVDEQTAQPPDSTRPPDCLPTWPPAPVPRHQHRRHLHLKRRCIQPPSSPRQRPMAWHTTRPTPTSRHCQLTRRIVSCGIIPIKAPYRVMAAHTMTAK